MTEEQQKRIEKARDNIGIALSDLEDGRGPDRAIEMLEEAEKLLDILPPKPKVPIRRFDNSYNRARRY